MTHHIALDIQAIAENASRVRGLVKEFLSESRFSPMWIERLVLIADELFTNAVKYGSMEEDHVKVEATMRDNCFTLSVTDTGNAHGGAVEVCHIEKLMERNSERGERAIRGRGLAFITKQWSDTLDIIKTEQGGFCVRITKDAANQYLLGGDAVYKNACAQEEVVLNLGELDQEQLDKTRLLFSELRDIADCNEGARFLFDFSGITKCREETSKQFAELFLRIKEGGGHITLLHVDEEVRKILEKIGIYDII